MRKLIFTRGNAKLDSQILTFSLPAGWSCPGASLCQSKIVKKSDGSYRVQDGSKCKFRCFAATDEAKYPTVRKSRWHNFNLLKRAGTTGKMAELINNSLPDSLFPIVVRIHVAGDFFNQSYFDAWLKVAQSRPLDLFYAYTKTIPFWINRKKKIPHNFKLTASIGGKFDNLVGVHKLKNARVVYSIREAETLKLPIDHDDRHAFRDMGNFALLLHGSQPAGTIESKAWTTLKKQGKGGYHNQKKGRLISKMSGGIPGHNRA